MKVCDASPACLAEAAELLRRGRLVAFPTETVYGLGADASNPEAVHRIFSAKGRPADHPLIVHLPEVALLDRWARAVPAAAWRLAERFWPGPLTLVLKRSSRVPDVVTGGQDTVGLRVPGHPVALALLSTFGDGLAAPSANRFGRVSPTTARHVVEELGDRVDLVIDGGPCRVGIESSIVDLSGEKPRLLRPGAVTREMLAECLGEPVVTGTTVDSPRVSGALPSHYAPETPVRLIPANAMSEEVTSLMSADKRVGVLSIHALPDGIAPWRFPMPDTPEEYARCLYARLREADQWGCDLIVVELPPESPAWTAIHDRLQRAAAELSQ
ncbi:MAG: L-threonylcarbamoyladenylate synthase [Gammaproteobacteria bacterium]